jgi:hypothetical protein
MATGARQSGIFHKTKNAYQTFINKVQRLILGVTKPKLPPEGNPPVWQI